MNKPITIQTKEFSESVVMLINNSELPAFIMANVLSNLITYLSDMALKQEAEDAHKWDEYLSNKKEADNG